MTKSLALIERLLTKILETNDDTIPAEQVDNVRRVCIEQRHMAENDLLEPVPARP